MLLASVLLASGLLASGLLASGLLDHIHAEFQLDEIGSDLYEHHVDVFYDLDFVYNFQHRRRLDDHAVQRRHPKRALPLIS